MKFIEKFTYICVCILSFIKLHSAFAKELGVCVDDEDFYFASFEFSTSDGAHVKQTCSWISDRKERIDQLCSIKTVQRACPMTCKTCSDEDVLNEHAQDTSSSSLGAPLNKSASMHKYTSVVGDEQNDDDDRDESNIFLHNGKRKHRKSGGKGNTSVRYCGKSDKSNKSRRRLKSDKSSKSYRGYSKSGKSSDSYTEVHCDTPSENHPTPYHPNPPQPHVTHSPTFTTSPLCTDHSTFTFTRENGETATCGWIDSAERNNRYCSRGHIKGACKETCNSCSRYNSLFFTFIANDGQSRDCDWISSNNMFERRRNYCYDSDGMSASRIGDFCPDSCGFYLVERNPVPSPIANPPVGAPFNNAPPVPSPQITPTIGNPIGSPFVDASFDSSDFTFIRNNGESTKCSWLTSANEETRIERYCDRGDVKGSCKRTCNNCDCEDDESFSFQANNGNIRSCAWISRNKVSQRRERYCFDDDGISASRIGDACVNSCEFCVNQENPTPLAFPVSSPVGTPINNSPPVPVPNGTPVSFPISTPVGTPQNAPLSTPVSFPSLVDTPVAQPNSFPISSPINSPASQPSPSVPSIPSAPISFPTPSGPVLSPVSFPVSTPNETPSGPVSSPISFPVSTPNETHLDLYLRQYLLQHYQPYHLASRVYHQLQQLVCQTILCLLSQDH